MVKHTQIIRQQQPTNFSSVFDDFAGWRLNGWCGIEWNVWIGNKAIGLLDKLTVLFHFTYNNFTYFSSFYRLWFRKAYKSNFKQSERCSVLSSGW